MQRQYKDQVSLLIRTIPHTAEEEVFALKDGTAFNLFHRENIARGNYRQFSILPVNISERRHLLFVSVRRHIYNVNKR